MAWRLYAWAYLALFAVGHWLLLRDGATFFDVIDIPLSACAAVGVLAFAYQRRVLSARWWRVFVPAFIAWELTYNLVLSAGLGLAQRDPEPWPSSMPANAIAVALVLAFAVPSFVALVRYAFPSDGPLKSLRTSVVATFSDEATAHAAASALEQEGIHAVVGAGNVGPQSGIPMPVGDMQVLVASRDREVAEALLAQARRRRGSQ